MRSGGPGKTKQSLWKTANCNKKKSTKRRKLDISTHSSNEINCSRHNGKNIRSKSTLPCRAILSLIGGISSLAESKPTTTAKTWSSTSSRLLRTSTRIASIATQALSIRPSYRQPCCNSWEATNLIPSSTISKVSTNGQSQWCDLNKTCPLNLRKIMLCPTIMSTITTSATS